MFLLLAAEVDDQVADLLVEGVRLLPGCRFAVHSHTVLRATGQKQMKETHKLKKQRQGSV